MDPNFGGSNGVMGMSNASGNNSSNSSDDELQRLISEAQKAQLEDKAPAGMDSGGVMPSANGAPAAGVQGNMSAMPDNSNPANAFSGQPQPNLSIGEIPVQQKSLDETQSTLVGGQPAAMAGNEGASSGLKQPPVQQPAAPTEELELESLQPVQAKQTAAPSKDPGIEEIINPPVQEKQTASIIDQQGNVDGIQNDEGNTIRANSDSIINSSDSADESLFAQEDSGSEKEDLAKKMTEAIEKYVKAIIKEST